MHKPAPAQGLDPIGYAFAVAAAVLFSSKGIFIKLAYAEGVGTEVLLALRMLFALPVYGVILFSLLRRRPELKTKLTKARLIPAMATGFLGYFISSYLDFAALNFISVQYGRLVLFTYPFFIVLFGALFFRERFDWRIVPGMLVSYAGIALMFGWSLVEEPAGLLEGTLLVLAAAITFAFYQLLAKGRMVELGSGLFTCIAMMTAALCAIAQGLVVAGPQTFVALSPTVLLLGLGLGIFSTVLPSFMMNFAISRIGARANSSTAAFGPVVTIFLAVLVLSEPFTLFHGLGTALVLLGSLLFTRAERQLRRAGP